MECQLLHGVMWALHLWVQGAVQRSTHLLLVGIGLKSSRLVCSCMVQARVRSTERSCMVSLAQVTCSTATWSRPDLAAACCTSKSGK